MIVALVGNAFTGKSSIARVLEEKHGYEIAGFSDYLKELTAHAINTIAPHRNLTVDEIKRDKDRLRRLVQEVGSVIGYDTDAGWIKAFMYNLPDEITGTRFRLPDTPCVIDCLRSETQVRGARAMGAQIVGIEATYFKRCANAARSKGLSKPGYGRMLVDQADLHPIDGALDLDVMAPDLRVVNGPGCTVAFLADQIANWAAPRFADELVKKSAQISRVEAAYGPDL